MRARIERFTEMSTFLESLRHESEVTLIIEDWRGLHTSEHHLQGVAADALQAALNAQPHALHARALGDGFEYAWLGTAGLMARLVAEGDLDARPSHVYYHGDVAARGQPDDPSRKVWNLEHQGRLVYRMTVVPHGPSKTGGPS